MQISTFKDDKSSVFETDTAVAKILKNDTDFYTGKICLGCANYRNEDCVLIWKMQKNIIIDQ